jgi:hypothetical protein
VAFFSLIGTFWRLWFWGGIKNVSDVSAYAFKFVGSAVPDLGFYTGLAADRTSYIGLKAAEISLRYLSVNNKFLGIFLVTFVFLGFIYIIFNEYRNKKTAYMGIVLMALGPVELFHMTSSIVGHSFAYVSIFPLFLLFKLEEKGIFWVALLSAIVMAFTYYTGSVVMLLASLGFTIALFAKDLIETRKLTKTLKNFLKNEKVQAFLLIAIILIGFIYIFSNMWAYSLRRLETLRDFLDINLATAYKDPVFLGLSALRWQMIFFFLCGLTFISSMIRKRSFSKGDIDLLFCLIPILIVSYGFLHVNLPTRIFDYFAFAGLFFLTIPEKYFKQFFILSFVFILISSFYIVKDKKIFFETSDKEIEGVAWIRNTLKGKIFSDQFFINQLILKGYFNVEGANDKSPLVYNLFYQDNLPVFLGAINILIRDLKIDYIVLTKRMQEAYILMLYPPQSHLINIRLYEDHLHKVYDNNDVRVYKLN